jgi:hypothetical protein
VSDATGLPAEHPALVTTLGPPGPPPPAGDATGLPGEHPALVSVVGFARTGAPTAVPDPVLVVVAPRKAPDIFRHKGLGVTIVLSRRARVEVVLVRRGRQAVKLSRTRRRDLRAGRSRLRLHPSIAGRLAIRARKGVDARVLVRVSYGDGTTETAQRSVALRPPRR